MEQIFWRLLFLALWAGGVYLVYVVWSAIVHAMPEWGQQATAVILLGGCWIGVIWYHASGRYARDKARAARSEDEIE